MKGLVYDSFHSELFEVGFANNIVRNCHMSHENFRLILVDFRCQDYFLKTAKNGLQPSTHLVLMEASGSKYQAAKKWGIPAIEKE